MAFEVFMCEVKSHDQAPGLMLNSVDPSSSSASSNPGLTQRCSSKRPKGSAFKCTRGKEFIANIELGENEQ